MYQIAKPFFYQKEIKKILASYKKILNGNGLMTMGPNVKNFETQFAKKMKINYAVATSSCTSALEIAIYSLGLKKNDEVIIPCQTFIATASSILRNNLKIKICEINEKFQINFDHLKKIITPRTKAVILVHYAGFIDNEIFEIKRFLKKKNIKLIEDCAHAIGAKKNGMYAGTIGDIGCFSFYSTKNLTTGEGGMIICKNKTLFRKMQSFRSRGLNYNSKTEEYNNHGTNARMTEFQAILGLHQLNRIDKITTERNKIAENYNKLLSKLFEKKKLKSFFDKEDKIKDINSYWKFPLKIIGNISRNKLQKSLKKKGIVIDWAYDPLIHKQKIIEKVLGRKKFAKSEKLTKLFFCLPIYYGLKISDQKIICSKLKRSLDDQS